MRYVTCYNKEMMMMMAFNSIFGKIGRIALEEVIFALIKFKCLLILLYGTEAGPTNSAVRHSLDFAFIKFCLKSSAHCLTTSTEISVIWNMFYRRTDLCSSG